MESRSSRTHVKRGARGAREKRFLCGSLRVSALSSFSVSSSARRRCPSARGPRRWRGAQPSGCRRCSAKPIDWRPRSARCSAICASSRSSGRSRREELKRVDADAAKVQAELDADERADGRAAGVGDAPNGPSCSSGSSRSTSSARRAICGLLLSTPGSAPARPGDAHGRRARQARSRSRRDARADARGAEEGRARRSRRARAELATRCAPTAEKAQAAAQRAAQAQDRPHPRHRQAARPERAAVRRAAGGAAETAGDAARSRDRRGRQPKPPAAVAPVPRRARLAGRGHRQPPVRPRRRPSNGIEIAAAEGADARRHPRRHRRVCGTVCRIRESGHRRPRSADLQLVWRFARHRRQEGRPDRARPAGRHGRADPVGLGRHLLRASRRRSARSILYNG